MTVDNRKKNNLNIVEKSKYALELSEEELNIIDTPISPIYAYGKYLKVILAAFLINKRREQESSLEAEEIYKEVIEWINDNPKEDELNQLLEEFLECIQLDEESTASTKIKDIRTQIQKALEQQYTYDEPTKPVYDLTFFNNQEEDDDQDTIITTDLDHTSSIETIEFTDTEEE